MIVRINWFKKKRRKKWKSCCVCSPSTLSSLSVLHHWIFKTKTETKTEYENKIMIVRINLFKKKWKNNERVVVCAHRLWLHRCLFFRTIDCSFGEKKFNSKICVSNEIPRFTFYSYKLLISFFFFVQVSPVVYKSIMALLYKTHNTYLQARSFCHTMNYNLFDGYIT